MAKISIFGIGYVGVVSAACLAKDGHDVVAVDVDPGKIDSINAGRSPIVEEGIDELVRELVAAGKLRATVDVEEAVASTDASFVCVGTPSAPDGSVGLVYVTEQGQRQVAEIYLQIDGYTRINVCNFQYDVHGVVGFE